MLVKTILNWHKSPRNTPIKTALTIGLFMKRTSHIDAIYVENVLVPRKIAMTILQQLIEKKRYLNVIFAIKLLDCKNNYRNMKK